MADTSEKVASALELQEPARVSRGHVRLGKNARTFRRWERVQIFFASWIGYLAVLIIGCSLRWEVFGRENYEGAQKMGRAFILTFWHREIFAHTWYWRKRGMVVMTSQNFDGEYIARIIQRHGYGAARGSSTRGAKRALKEMIRATRQGLETAFTIDGPRGPRFVAKPGSVLLAKATGAPILCSHIALRHAYVFRKSWDLFQIPCPLTRAAVFFAPPLVVSREAEEEEQARKLQEVQATLDELRARGKKWAGDSFRNSKSETPNSSLKNRPSSNFESEDRIL